MKVYGIFKIDYKLPFQTEHLVELHQFESDAKAEVDILNNGNDDPAEGDCYGFYSGCKYYSVEIEVK